MNLELLQQAINGMKQHLEAAITTATFNGRNCADGHVAKQALIRSHGLIFPIHEVVKRSLADELQRRRRQFEIHPPLDETGPELKISGFIKAKDQDIVVLFDGDTAVTEQIQDGPLAGEQDVAGRRQSERGIVIGVRSQMSSVAKNFDTLMERAFAETLNLRLRLPGVTMGEVYVLPVVEYDDLAMLNNQVAWKRRAVNVVKFIKTFLAITHRAPENPQADLYKYERSALVLVDFRPVQARIYLTLEELRQDELVPENFQGNFAMLSPDGFARDLLEMHAARHPIPNQR
jgi:hypothetical protein